MTIHILVNRHRCTRPINLRTSPRREKKISTVGGVPFPIPMTADEHGATDKSIHLGEEV